MAALALCGGWLVSAGGSKVTATHSREPREPFVFDCSRAKKRLKEPNDVDRSDADASEETGSDRILALTVSSSGKLMALTDDSKRLVLFESEPSWRCVSIRWVVRRCTSLVFSRAEDELLAADKSGDVYSFSVVEAEKLGELKMGHLSMLLAVTLSADDRFIITADRDEKIRVSHHRSPYNIQSYCLGHQQFVSALEIPSVHPSWLLSGSGDGTIKLWEFESGRRLQSVDLKQLEDDGGSDTTEGKNTTVFRVCSSPGGRDVAALCEGVMKVYIFTLDQSSQEKLKLHSKFQLSHRPLDMTFDLDGQLWVLLDSRDVPLQILTLRQNSWESDTENNDLNKVIDVFRNHWSTTDDSTSVTSSFEQLYKVSFDNVSAYMQKKQQRIEQNQLKRTKAQETKPNKRSKNSDPVSSEPSV